jgi:hypothetical protein
MWRLAVWNGRVWLGEQDSHAICAPDEGEACSRVLIGTSVDESDEVHELVTIHTLDCFSPWTFLTAHHMGVEGGRPQAKASHARCMVFAQCMGGYGWSCRTRLPSKLFILGGREQVQECFFDE